MDLISVFMLISTNNEKNAVVACFSRGVDTGDFQPLWRSALSECLSSSSYIGKAVGFACVCLYCVW